MEGKILFFDIDGTLVGPSRSLTQKNLDALQAAKEMGYLLFISTGRALTSIYPALRELNFDGYITSAGSIIYVDEQIIYEHYIQPKLVESCLHLFADRGIPFTLETKHALYQTPGVRRFFDQLHADVDPANLELTRMKQLKRNLAHILPFAEYHSAIPVSKITFVAPHKEKFMEIRPFFEENFHVVLFSDDHLPYCNGELIMKDCTKGDALKKVCDFYHLPYQASIAFGDSMNDYEMLQAAGKAIVYEHACDALKNLADAFFVEPDHDGIYLSMKDLGLI